MVSVIKVEGNSEVTMENCRVITGGTNTNFVECDSTSKFNMKNCEYNNDIINKKIFKVHMHNKHQKGLNSKYFCGSNRKLKDCCIKILEKLNLNDSDNVCLVIGNRFNISARNYLKSIGMPINMDTSDFFNWELESICNSGKLIDDFPVLKKHLGEVQHGKSFEKVEELNNYANELIKNEITNEEGDILICELKYYISIAFSYFQEELDKKDISQWSWCRVLKLLKNKLSYIVSFNYELLLETALENFKYII